MSANAEDVYLLLRKIRYDATAIQAKLTDVMRLLAELNIQDAPQVTCSSCGLGFRGARTLQEHVYTSHNGPLPEHWQHTDELAQEPV